MRAQLRTKARIPADVRTDLAQVLLSLTRDMSVWFMALRLRIDQPKASALRHGRLEILSVERLMVLATRLGCDVEIRVNPPPRSLLRGPRPGRGRRIKA